MDRQSNLPLKKAARKEQLNTIFQIDETNGYENKINRKKKRKRKQYDKGKKIK